MRFVQTGEITALRWAEPSFSTEPRRERRDYCEQEADLLHEGREMRRQHKGTDEGEQNK